MTLEGTDETPGRHGFGGAQEKYESQPHLCIPHKFIRGGGMAILLPYKRPPEAPYWAPNAYAPQNSWMHVWL